jgi:hypothetical protein
MPTARELDLFQQCDGGSGDARTDEKLAKKMGNIINIPEQQMVAFIRTRDKNSVQKLQNVLEDMPCKPGTAPAGNHKSGRNSPPSLRSQSMPGRMQDDSSRPGTCSSPLLDRRKNAQARLQDMGVLKTSYGAFHSALGESQGCSPKYKTPAAAFDGVIRRNYQQDFEQWKEVANEKQVKVLADTCRALRYFNSEEKIATSYTATHTEFPGHKAVPPPEKTNHGNVSVVPLGSIYTQSEEEALRAKKTQEMHEQGLMSATMRQADWRNGKAEGKHHKLQSYGEIPGATIHQNMKTTPHQSGMKSVTRESWHSDVHSYSQKQRHNHKFIKPGEFDWNMAGVTGHGVHESIHNLRDPKVFPGKEGHETHDTKFFPGAPNRQRVVKSKRARFADENSKLLLSASSPSF